MMSNQEKFKKLQEATRARKANEAGNYAMMPTSSAGLTSSSMLPTPNPTPTPSVTNYAATSPQHEVVGEKRGSSILVEGLHRLERQT
jgi:hypothetical protein